MSKDRIAEVFPDLDPWGLQLAERLVEAVAKQVIRQGVTSIILTTESDQRIDWPDYPGAAQCDTP